MSMTKSNVVPFDTTTPAPTPPPWPPGPWPYPPGMLPGCAPPGGMDNLMGCYWSVQQATAFISAIMIDAINNNPAVIQAIMTELQEANFSMPLIGVTDGSHAQPGQVGEFVQLNGTLNYPATAQAETYGSLGVLQPGDWNCWMGGVTTTVVTDLSMALVPTPTGFNSNMEVRVEMPNTAGWQALPPGVGSCSISVPTLIAVQVGTNWTGTPGPAGSFAAYFCARRMR